jgi:PleD family two-component response regulator
MTSAFSPRHRAVPLTLISHVSNNGNTEPESTQEELEAVEIEMSEQTPARILVVDDHEIVRKGICTMLREEDDFEVVGETGTGNMVITLAMI